MNLNGDSRGDRIFPNNIWIQFAFPIFSDYSTQFPYGQLGQLGTRTVNILEFLMWLVKHDIDIPPTSGLNFAPDATFEMKPWHGFRRILSILQSSEDSRIGMCMKFHSTDLLKDKNFEFPKQIFFPDLSLESEIEISFLQPHDSESYLTLQSNWMRCSIYSGALSR